MGKKSRYKAPFSDAPSPKRVDLPKNLVYFCENGLDLKRTGTMKKTLSYGIIGNGKVARHIMHYFSMLGIQYTNWSRSEKTSLSEKLSSVDVVLILINDSSIESFYKNHLFLNNKTCVHFSGALNIDGIIGVHPLMTFSLDLYPFDVYQKIPFIIEKGSFKFQDLFPNLINPHYEIAKEQKAFYHAKCVMASNYLVLILNNYYEYLNKEIGIPKDDTMLLIDTTLANVKLLGIKALTGPISRGDLSTIEKNISSLKLSGEDQLYEKFISTYFPNIKDKQCSQ